MATRGFSNAVITALAILIASFAAVTGAGQDRGAQPPAARGAAPGATAPAAATPAASWEQQRLATLDNASLKRGLKLIWFSTGVDDGLMANTKNTVEMLKKHGFNPVFKESPGAHTWLNWRNYLIEFAGQLFR